LSSVEARLAGVLVAALKEAFDRDAERLRLEREQLEADRQRADRALRLERIRQAGERELGRLRLTAIGAVVSFIGALAFSGRLIDGGIGARSALAGAWTLLLAALAAAFVGHAHAGRLLASVDPRHDGTFEPAAAGLLAPWLLVAGLGLLGLALFL
jgi:hypothetical protein